MWEDETPSDTIDMAAELRQRIERLYLAALQASGEERSALLQRSEPEVRRAVEDLLAHDASDRLPPQDPDTDTVTVPGPKLLVLARDRGSEFDRIMAASGLAITKGNRDIVLELAAMACL